MYRVILSIALFFVVIVSCYGQKATILVNYTKLPDSVDVWTGNPAFDIKDNFVYVVYTDPTTLKGKICRYNITSGEAVWSNDLFDTVALDDISHNDAALIIDGDGFIHVWIGMHNHSMKYYRSTSPGSYNSFKNCSTEMPNYQFGKTYPWVTSSPNGDVFMMCRRTAGVHDEKQDFYHWNNKNKRWTMQTVAAKPADCAYMGSIYGDDYGNVHIAIAWASFHIGDNRFQKGMYMRYNIEEDAYYKADDTKISIPVSHDTDDADLFYNSLYEWGAGPEIQTPRITTNVKSNPVIAYPHSTDLGENWTYKAATWNNDQWEQTVLCKDANLYARPPVTFTNGTVNVFMTSVKKDKIRVASIKEHGKSDDKLVLKKGHYYAKMALKYNATTDLLITRKELIKIEY